MLLKWVLVSEKRHTNLLACVLEKPKNSGMPEDLESTSWLTPQGN